MTVKPTQKFPDVASASTKKTGAATPPVNLNKPLEISEIKSENATNLRSVQQSFKRRLQNMRKSPLKYAPSQIEELIFEIDTEIKTHKSLEHTGSKVTMNGRQVMAQLADLKESTGHVSDDAILLSSMLADLETLLPIVLDRELYHWFVGEMVKIKSELNELKLAAHGNEAVIRKDRADLLILQRVAQMKGYGEDTTALRGDIMKTVEVCGSIPKQVREILFHPVWMSRKFEKEFTVIVNKSSDTHSKNDGCSISGSSKDVDACVSKLETLDISGKRTLLLDGRTLSTIMGVGGANALEVEKECNVLLFAPAGSVELTIFGSEAAVNKALKRIGDVKEIQTSASSASGIVAERVKCRTCVAKALRAEQIEGECGVTISANPISESENRDSWLVIRGPAEGVASAVHSVNLAMAAMGVETIDGISMEAAGVLFATNTGTTAPKKGLSEIKLVIRFNDLKKRASFFLADGEIDVAVSDPNSMEAVVGELLEILEKISWSTDKLLLERDQSRIWTEPICRAVAAQCAGAELLCRRSDDNQYTLEIWGDERARELAGRLVREVLSPKLLAVPEECIKPMLENKCQVLQSLQAEAVVSVHFDRFENSLFVYGLTPSKRLAERQFAEFVDSVRQALLQSTVKTIPIATDEIGRLIGPKGRVMNGIKEKAGIEEIRVSELEGKVYLVGANSGIDHAVSLIEEELSAKKDSSVVQIGLAEDAETAAVLSGQSKGESGKTVGLLGARTDEWVTGAGAKPPTELTDDPDQFPALGLGACIKPKAPPKLKRK